jgi:hypothetical protein
MSINTIMFAWRRSVPGREHISASHFEEFVDYLSGLQTKGLIESFDAILLDPNGSHCNGFFLIKGEDAKLGQMLDSAEWDQHIIRSMLHLDEPVLAYGVSGAPVRDRMATWVANIPK